MIPVLYRSEFWLNWDVMRDRLGDDHPFRRHVTEIIGWCDRHGSDDPEAAWAAIRPRCGP